MESASAESCGMSEETNYKTESTQSIQPLGPFEIVRIDFDQVLRCRSMLLSHIGFLGCRFTDKRGVE